VSCLDVSEPPIPCRSWWRDPSGWMARVRPTRRWSRGRTRSSVPITSNELPLASAPPSPRRGGARARTAGSHPSGTHRPEPGHLCASRAESRLLIRCSRATPVKVVYERSLHPRRRQHSETSIARRTGPQEPRRAVFVDALDR
jgi:hypothetical protein